MRKSKGRKLTAEWKEKIRQGLLNSKRVYEPHSEETKEKIRIKIKAMPISEGLKKGWKLAKDKVGDKHPKWKGDNVHYITFHKWLSYHYGKASICENMECPHKNPKRFEWALVHGKTHSKNKDNYMQLCCSCHRKYDINNYNIKRAN